MADTAAAAGDARMTRQNRQQTLLLLLLLLLVVFMMSDAPSLHMSVCHVMKKVDLYSAPSPKPLMPLDLSSSSSCWNIGRRAFSISVCRWQISLHTSM